MINVVYAGNRFVFKGILLSCMSMIRSCKKPIHIYIMTMDVTDKKPSHTPIVAEQAELLDKILKEVNSESLVTLMDVTDEYNEVMKENANSNTSYTPYTLIRLMLDMYEEIPDKFIYIDVDTMLVNSIEQLYNIDIEQYEFGAVLDYMGHFWISPKYCNAGVMLFNLKKMKETKLLEKSRRLIMTKWLKLADQSALNRLVTNKLILDGKFNEQRDIKPDTVVKHFCKGIKYFPFFHIYNIKQWDIENVHNKLKIYEFDEIYVIYENLLKKYDFIN